MAETRQERDDLDWPIDCLRTVKGLTSNWELAHVPALAASLVHVLVKLLAIPGPAGGASGAGADHFSGGGGGGGRNLRDEGAGSSPPKSQKWNLWGRASSGAAHQRDSTIGGRSSSIREDGNAVGRRQQQELMRRRRTESMGAAEDRSRCVCVRACGALGRWRDFFGVARCYDVCVS